MIELFIVMNVFIAVAYVGNGLWLAPRLQLGTGTAQKVIRISAMAFFVLCALTHVEMALHAYEMPAGITSSIHSLLIHGLQGPAGIIFLLVAKAFVGIQVVGEPDKPKPTLTLHDYEERWKFARDILLFFFGALGIAYSATQAVRDPVLITAFSAMMGLPVILRGEEKVKSVTTNNGGNKPNQSAS